jgi:hypothetical protein
VRLRVLAFDFQSRSSSAVIRTWKSTVFLMGALYTQARCVYNRKGMANQTEMLKAMRWVAMTVEPEGHDREPLQRKCRQWMIDDFKGFMSKLADLEKANEAAEVKREERRAARQEKKSKEGLSVEKDEGTVRVEEMLERWLAPVVCVHCGKEVGVRDEQ